MAKAPQTNPCGTENGPIGIHVPSYKRSGKADTFKLIPGATFWIHAFEIQEYRDAYPDHRIREIPDDLRGNIAKVRNFILDTSVAEGEDACLMVDDDLSEIGRWIGLERISLKSEEEIRGMIRKYTDLAREWGARLWGINVNADRMVYRQYTPFSTTSYLSASFSCFLRENTLRYDERLPLKEDYDMAIQQANKHRILLRINAWSYRKKSAENPGGCATYRSIKAERDQFRLLQEKWGSEIVRVDKSKNGTSGKDEITVRAWDINPVIKIPIRGV